jgi:Uma2 family endonuclease
MGLQLERFGKATLSSRDLEALAVQESLPTYASDGRLLRTGLPWPAPRLAFYPAVAHTPMKGKDADTTRTLSMVGIQIPSQEKSASITQRVTLHGISWQTYTRILAELGDHRASRLAYAQGVLEITMPSDRHETYKKLLERMIETLTEELNLPAKSFGATTLNRADLERGAEPDSCYYIQHVHQIEGRQVDLTTDPPPDLILEIDIASPSSRRLDIYKRLGVPEIWRYVGGTLQIYRLQDGEYVPSDRSPSFPIVSTIVINQFLHQAEAQDDTTFIRTWRQWVRLQASAEPA